MDKNLLGFEYPVKLVVIDLDGTFLRDDKSIHEDNLTALSLLAEKGIPYSIATGRSYVSAYPFLDYFSDQVPVILQNGALLLDPVSMDKLDYTALDRNIAEYVFSRAAHYGLHCVISIGWLQDACLWLNKPYAGIYMPYLEKHGIRFSMNCSPELFVDNEISEIILLGSEPLMHHLIQDAVNYYGDNFSIIKSFEWEGETFLEIMGPKVSKSFSLMKLCWHMHIPVQSVLFIGDNYNDLDAMNTAGYPVAVSNALDHVKDLACFVSKSNNEGGVGYAIRHMLDKWPYERHRR